MELHVRYQANSLPGYKKEEDEAAKHMQYPQIWCEIQALTMLSNSAQMAA